MNRFICMMLCLLMIYSLSSCREYSIDNIDESNAESDTTQEYGYNEKNNTYKNVIHDENLDITVNVDAKVRHLSDELSVYTVEQINFTDENIALLKNKLMGGEQLYDAISLAAVKKSTVEAQIAAAERHKNEMSQSEYEALIKYYKLFMQEEAVDEINVTAHLSDGKIHTVSEMYEKYADGYYRYHNIYNPDGEILDVINDGSDGEYLRLYVYNSEEYGNKLSFRKSTFEYIDNRSIKDRGELKTIEKTKNQTIPEGMLYDLGNAPGDTYVFAPFPDEAVTLSLEDAKDAADDLLFETGLDAFEFIEGDKYFEYVNTVNYFVEGADYMYRTYYILRYERKIDGVYTKQLNSVGGEYSEEKGLNNEFIMIRVNDDGIVGFDYYNPISIKETTQQNLTVKEFEEIRKILEKKAVTELTQQNMAAVYNIDNITLGYVRINDSEKSTSMLMPAWFFSGNYEFSLNGNVLNSGSGIIFCINAIDGSVVSN